jgi:hypothetical protein
MTTNANGITRFTQIGLRAKRFSPLPSHNLTCPVCQCPVECWKAVLLRDEASTPS